MISFKQVKGRQYWGMSKDDLTVFAELIWLLKHNPPPIGFNRKPLTTKQERIIDDFYDRIIFGDNYAESLNAKTGQ